MQAGSPHEPLRGTVYAVEADPVTRRLMQLYLRPLGYTVRLAAAYEDLAGNGLTACVALVLNLDDAPEDAAEVLERLKAAHPDIPLIGLASSERSLEQDFVMQHFPRVLFKPLKAEELVLAVQAEPVPSPGADAATAPPEGAAEEELLAGLDSLREEMGLEGELVAELVDSFLSRSSGYLEQIDAALDRGDAAELDRVTHAMKGMAGNLRFAALTAACDALRQTALEGELAEAQALRDRVAEAYERVRQALLQRWPQRS